MLVFNLNFLVFNFKDSKPFKESYVGFNSFSKYIQRTVFKNSIKYII